MVTSSDKIFLVKQEGGLCAVPRRGYDAEVDLQKLIEMYPDLLAGDQISQEDPVRWLLIEREVGIDTVEGTSRMAVDHLLLDQNAIPTFVEVKRCTDTRIRREVVGQMLDYAANAEKYWPVDRIKELARIRLGSDSELDRKVLELLDPGDDTADVIGRFWRDVEKNLRDGSVRLLFVADELPPELRRIIEFLNTQMERAEVLGVELPQYAVAEHQLLVPRVVGQTELTRQRRSRGSSGPRTTPKEFLEKCDSAVANYFQNLLAECQRRKLTIHWGTKGFSARVDLGGKLYSILYGFPPGTLDRKNAFLQCYLRDLPCNLAEFRNELVSLHGCREAGQFTLDLEVTGDSVRAAEQVALATWKFLDELEKLPRV